MKRAFRRRGVAKLTQLVGGTAVAAGCAARADAQGPTAADVLQSATEIVATLEDPERCDLSLHGTPSLDDLTERWLVAFSGVGTACDETSAALQRAGIEANIAFFRRPSSNEIRALIGTMRAAVRRGFDCTISFSGEPRFDDESQYRVAFQRFR
jgi:hypothetical protein